MSLHLGTLEGYEPTPEQARYGRALHAALVEAGYPDAHVSVTNQGAGVSYKHYDFTTGESYFLPADVIHRAFAVCRPLFDQAGFPTAQSSPDISRDADPAHEPKCRAGNKMTRKLRTGEPTVVMTFRLATSTLERIKAKAAKKDQPPAVFVRDMVEERFSAERMGVTVDTDGSDGGRRAGADRGGVARADVQPRCKS